MRYALILAVLAAAATSVSAQEAAPVQPTAYMVTVYLSLAGRGRAYVIGPLEAQACGHAAARVKTNPPPFAEDVPPDEQLSVSSCYSRDQLPGVLYSSGCSAAVDGKAVPKMPGVKMWLYSCFRG